MKKLLILLTMISTNAVAHDITNCENVSVYGETVSQCINRIIEANNDILSLNHRFNAISIACQNSEIKLVCNSYGKSNANYEQDDFLNDKYNSNSFMLMNESKELHSDDFENRHTNYIDYGVRVTPEQYRLLSKMIDIIRERNDTAENQLDVNSEITNSVDEDYTNNKIGELKVTEDEYRLISNILYDMRVKSNLSVYRFVPDSELNNNMQKGYTDSDVGEFWITQNEYRLLNNIIDIIKAKSNLSKNRNYMNRQINTSFEHNYIIKNPINKGD